MAKVMHSQLERRYGKGEVKIQHEPDSFAGYTIQRDRSRRALTLTMASVIEAAARVIACTGVRGGSHASRDGLANWQTDARGVGCHAADACR